MLCSSEEVPNYKRFGKNALLRSCGTNKIILKLNLSIVACNYTQRFGHLPWSVSPECDLPWSVSPECNAAC